MKLSTEARLPQPNAPDFDRTLYVRLYELFRDIATQVNGMSEGSIVAAYNAATALPTTGKAIQGDVLRNRTPTELGSAGSKYVVTGWICITSGNPATWREMRCLTGN